MTVNEVIALAQAGELSNLSPTIKNSNDAIVGYINLGLVELYKRFQLRTDEAIITLQDGKTIYKLDGTDADVSMGNGSFMFVIGAYEERSEDNYSDDDYILPINEEDNIYSINTPSYNEVQIPLVTTGALIYIIYASGPTKASVAALDAELDIPDQFVEPLLNYIGYRAHGSMDGNIQTESNTHYMRFEASCDRIRQLGVGITGDDMEMNTRISDRGFK